MPLATLTNVNGPLQALSIQDAAAKLSLRRRSGRESASTKALQGKRFTQVSMGHWGFTCRPTAKLRPILLPIKWARAKLTGQAKAAFGAHLLAKQIVNVGKGVPHKKRLPKIAN